MFSEHMGETIVVEDRVLLHTRAGIQGHAVYGPYDHVRPGVFLVEFDLALGGAASTGSQLAVIDIAAYRGTAVLSAREIGGSDLGAEVRTFSLELVNREFRSLEYRVWASGAAELLIGQPRVTRIGDVQGPAPEPDPSQPTSDPVELQAQVRKVLRLLRPHRAIGVEKVRLGHAGDGGYVCLDDFARLDVALSMGINDDISWDLDIAARGLIVHQFDHTVEDPAPADARMIFNRKMIAAVSSDSSATLRELVDLHDAGGRLPNMMLKFDIEGGEWPMLQNTDAARLGRFSQILCEIHYLDWLVDAPKRAMIYECLSKLHEHYAVVHVHANICGNASNIANIVLPHTLELTFANRALYAFADTDELFPGPLDISCDAYQPDFYLGAFRY